MKQKKKISLMIWLIGMMTILACNAVISPTPTPLPPTATATVVPLPTSTSTVTPVPPTTTVEPDILYQDDFSSNAHGWNTGTESAEGGSTEMNITDGQYVITLSSKSEYFTAMVTVPEFSGKDFVMNLDATILDTTIKEIPDNLWLSFDVRASDPNYYSFGFFMGDARLIRSKSWETKDDVVLWDWMNSSALKLEKGMTNTFKFEVNESTFTLYVNDQKINSATDDSLNESGGIDFTVLLAGANETLSIAFDNLVIQSPK